MAITYDQVKKLKEEYDDEYRKRHDAFKNLRRYWQGDFWKMADTESRSIVSVFRDLTARTSDVGPDVKLVHNVIQMVCVKYQSFLTPLPQIRVYVDPPESDTRRAQATLKERFLYGSWANPQMPMSTAFNKIAWYLPLMGDAFLGAIPDPETNLVTPVIRSPEYAYPIMGFDGNSEEAILFAWKINESTVARMFPGYVRQADRNKGRGIFRKSGSDTDPKIEILEYHDGQEWARFMDGQRTHGVEHKFGFNLFEHLKFIDVPDEPWGHGAVEQAINLNEMGNALYSLLFQSVIENVFPRLVLEDPAKAPEEIETGPGAVLPLNSGGKAYFLGAPSPGNFEQFMGLNEHNIKEASGMGETNFGVSPASSIVTGKAVDALQGAGSGSMVEMVQGAGLGTGIVKWNEKAIRITQQMFRDDKISLYGAPPGSIFDLYPNLGSIELTGKKLVGSARNEVVFAPAISQHEKAVMGLQLLGAGIWSKKKVREQVGEPDSESMDEEILAEAVNEAVLGAILGQLQAEPTPENAGKIEDQAYAYLQGQTGNNPAPHVGQASPGLLASGPPGAQPAGPPQPGAPPQLPAGPSAPPPAGPPSQAPTGPPQQAAAGGNTVSLDEVQAAFQQVQGIVGKVYLVGEIVLRGQTDSDIEVAVTKQEDKKTLSDALPQYAGRLVFHGITGEPNEPFVQVTPGSPTQRGGAVQSSPEALRHLFVQ